MKFPHSTFHIPHSKKGFTLVELLLYVGTASILLLATSLFFFVLLQSRVKNQTIAEVEQQGLQVMQSITQTVRNAEAITVPSAGSSTSSLTLDVVTAASDPTVLHESSGVIRITEGIGSPVALTNSRVTASGLTFQNLSRTGTPGTIRIQFTLTQVNPEGRNEYSFTRTFTGSATLRQP